jgi:hypothetical protein
MTTDKAAIARARATDAALSAATEKLAALKLHLAKLETTREEAIINERMIEEIRSGQEKIVADIRESLALLEMSLGSLRKSGTQGGYVVDRLGQMEEEFSEIVNGEIDELIRRAGSDLSDQTTNRLRDALEGAMTAPLKSALQGLTRHRRKVVLETIIETMMDEAIDDSSADDADGGE